jgi:hypothetical protein
MDRASQPLTVKLLVLELQVPGGNPTLTHDVAHRFTLPFTSQSGWHATIRPVETHTAGVRTGNTPADGSPHYEAGLPPSITPAAWRGRISWDPGQVPNTCSIAA